MAGGRIWKIKEGSVDDLRKGRGTCVKMFVYDKSGENMYAIKG
jgi:hypothetical protein